MTTSIQNTKALTSIANDGILLQPYIVDKIVDSKGNIVKQNTKTEIERVASKQTTDKMKDLMEQVVLSGTGSSYNMPGYNLIAKTGTAQISSTNGTGYLKGANDVIRGFAGMFPKDDPEIIIYANLKRPNPNTPNALVSVIKELVVNISKYYNIYDETVVNEQEIKYELTTYINKSIDKVKSDLEKNGIKPIVIGDGDRITDQYPNSNITITSGNKVFLKTNGVKYVLEDMTGWSKKDVLTYLKLLGLNYNIEGTGYLVSQSIASGNEVNSETIIDLVFESRSDV